MRPHSKNFATLLIEYMQTLRLRGGDLDGQLMMVWGWQRRWIRETWSKPGDSGLSCGRGNGKSGLLGALLAAVVDVNGPLTSTRAEAIVVAATLEQARVVYDDCVGFLEGLGYDTSDKKLWTKQSSSNKCILQFKPTGARIRAVGNNPNAIHGARPKIICIDEPAQHERGTRDRTFSALKTSLGKTPGSRLLAIGTRPSDPEHWFSRLLDDPGPDQTSHVYAVPVDAAVSDKWHLTGTWKLANPSFRKLPSLRRVLKEDAVEAARDSSARQRFRALRLNQGVDDTTRLQLISGDDWKACEVETLPPAEGPLILGVDLGGTRSMTALCGFWPFTGRCETIGAFPMTPTLKERAAHDSVPANLYELMRSRKEIYLCGDAVVDVSAFIKIAWNLWGRPAAVVGDRWKDGELIEALENAGIPSGRLVLRGQGFRDGTLDSQNFIKAVLGGKVKSRVSMLVRSALEGCVLKVDDAGNMKIAKSSEANRRQRHRDDAACAMVLAISEGYRIGSVPGRDGKRERVSFVV